MLLRLHGLVYRLAQEAPPLSEKELFEHHHKEKSAFLIAAKKAWERLVPELLALGEMASSEGQSKKQTKEIFLEEAASNLSIKRFLSSFSLGDKDSVLSYMAKVALEGKSPQSVWTSLNRWLDSTFVERIREEAKVPMKTVGLPSEVIKSFLPSPFAFEVGPRGNIVREFSVFGNKLKTEEKKRQAMAQLLDQWTDLTNRLNADLESPDPVTRLTALVASIVVATGIRPGTGGESKLKDDFGKIVRDDEGNPIRVPTVGATGLRAEHIQFIRDDYAKIEFTGKAGTKNIAEVSDPNLVRALKAQIALTKKGGSGLAFETEDGRKVTPKDVNSYLQSLLGPSIVATDFRKLRATQAFYDAIRAREDELAEELRSLKEEASFSVEEEIVETIISKLEEAAAEAQRAISHTDVRTTIESYINPRVVLTYLTHAGLPMALSSIIGDGHKLKVAFDPFDFFEKVSGGRMRAVASTLFSQGEEFIPFSIDTTIEELEEP